MTPTAELLAYVGLGSNAPDAAHMLDAAQAALERLEGVRRVRAASRYATEPQDYVDQPWFENTVLELAVDGERWGAREFLAALLGMEAALGRRRDPSLRYGPRAIDMDLLLFGEEVSADIHCLLPHPRLCQRAFVLVPLAELAPDRLINGLNVRQWLDRLAWRREGRAIFQ